MLLVLALEINPPTPATPNLNWKRETQIKNVQSHVRLEVIMVVDENKRRIITAVKAGGPYERKMSTFGIHRLDWLMVRT